MTIKVTNLHPNLTINTERRKACENHNDDFNYWQQDILSCLPTGVSIDEAYDIVCIYEGETLIHLHYLMYSGPGINAVCSNLNLVQKSEAFTNIVLADSDQPLQSNTLNFIFKNGAESLWEAKVESKGSHASIDL